MALLAIARLLIAAVPFGRWRHVLGGEYDRKKTDTYSVSELDLVRLFAGHVERAAWRLPFEWKCLPKAMALSWMLRRHSIGHCVVIAIRPASMRLSQDALHAWVEVAGEKVIGDLPGPSGMRS